MTNKEILKKKIIYRAVHRGTKEMDILLGNFVEKYINSFNYDQLIELEDLLSKEDELLFKIYFERNSNHKPSNSKVSKMLKNFKI